MQLYPMPFGCDASASYRQSVSSSPLANAVISPRVVSPIFSAFFIPPIYTGHFREGSSLPVLYFPMVPCLLHCLAVQVLTEHNCFLPGFSCPWSTFCFRNLSVPIDIGVRRRSVTVLEMKNTISCLRTNKWLTTLGGWLTQAQNHQKSWYCVA